MFCAKFGWNWHSVSGEKVFINFVCVFFAISLLYLLGRGNGFPFEKIEYPSPKDAKFDWYCPSGSSNFVDVFSLYRNLFLDRGRGPLFKKTLCAKFGWNWPIGSVKDDKNAKILQTNRRRTIRKAHELKILIFEKIHLIHVHKITYL